MGLYDNVHPIITECELSKLLCFIGHHNMSEFEMNKFIQMPKYLIAGAYPLDCFWILFIETHRLVFDHIRIMHKSCQSKALLNQGC